MTCSLSEWKCPAGVVLMSQMSVNASAIKAFYFR